MGRPEHESGGNEVGNEGKARSLVRRRGNGEGSITRRKDGRYQIQFEVERVNGSRNRVVQYARTMREAQEKLRVLRQRNADGRALTESRQLLSIFMAAWLDDVVRFNVCPSTHKLKQSLATHHIIPALGHIPIGRIQPSDVQRLITSTHRAGLSSSTVNQVRGVLRQALQYAVETGLLSRNVADNIRPPRVQHKEAKIPTPDVTFRLVDAALNAGRDGRVIVLLALTGLRRGEVLGLRWVDVNLDAANPTVLVHQSLDRHTRTLVEPKTAKSRRTIVLPTLVAEALRRQRAAQAAERLAAGTTWVDHGLVFTTPTGEPLDARNVTRSWKHLLRAHDIPDMRIHDLRHFASSVMISGAVPLTTVSRTLGHSSIRTTVDRYGHLLPGDTDNAARAVDRLFNERPTNLDVKLDVNEAPPTSADGAAGF